MPERMLKKKMTEKDLKIQDLREENRKLKEQLAEMEAKSKWILADNPPEEDKYVLLSFENYTGCDIGRYERNKDGSGAFYPRDDEKSYLSYELFVNAWMPLPEPYREDE